MNPRVVLLSLAATTVIWWGTWSEATYMRQFVDSAYLPSPMGLTIALAVAVCLCVERLRRDRRVAWIAAIVTPLAAVYVGNYVDILVQVERLFERDGGRLTLGDLLPMMLLNGADVAQGAYSWLPVLALGASLWWSGRALRRLVVERSAKHA